MSFFDNLFKNKKNTHPAVLHLSTEQLKLIIQKARQYKMSPQDYILLKTIGLYKIKK
jgi:septum formation topological specificity factor MinE